MALTAKIRDNAGMKENVRLIFSGLWFPATACLFAGIVLFLFTLGGYWEFLLWALGAWTICTVTVIVVSLDA